MKSRRDEFEAAPPLVRFLERIRKSFSHDLRTPLGTIVNYAAVLEANQGSDAEEVRDLGRRIRSNAQRVARMVQLLATATSLASRPMQTDPTDLVALAKSVLGDGGGAGRVLSSGNPKQLFADVDAEIVGFAWRAFVAVQNDARGKPIDELEVAIQPAEAVVWIDVASHSGESSSSTRALADVVGVGYRVPRLRGEPTDVFAKRILKKREPRLSVFWSWENFCIFLIAGPYRGLCSLWGCFRTVG